MIAIKRRLSYIFRPDSGLRLRVMWDGKNIVVLSGGFIIDRQKWNGTRCTRNSVHGKSKVLAGVINQHLDYLEEKVDMIFREFEVKGYVPSKEEFKNAYYGRDAVKTSADFWKATTQFTVEGEREHQWAFNTIKSIKQVINLLREFDPNLTFDKLNAKKLSEFVVYQQKRKLSTKQFKNGQKGYSNAVIIKNCRVVKWFLRWAADKEYIDRSVESAFKPQLKTIEKPVVFLKWDELIRMYEHDFESDLKNKVRDFFCFCCFTSLRYSDAASLTKSRVKENHIEVVTQKTSRLLKIELNKYSHAILNRYKDAPGQFALPQISLWYVNHFLKEMGKELEIDDAVSISQYYGGNRIETCVPKYELLSSHCGRRTFICNALSLGISPAIVMKWTGHSEYSAMKPYIDIADEIKATSMKKFDEYM